MAGKWKEDPLTIEDKLKAALVPEAEQPYPIPENWIWTKLHSVVSINPSKKRIDDVDPNAAVTFVPMAAVDDISGEITAALQRPLIEVKTGYTQFIEGDVIFAKITPCMENGKAAIVKETINGIAYGSTEFYVLRPLGIDASLLYFFVRAQSFRNEAKQVMSGAVGQQRVPKAWLEQHPIPLPPLTEQQRIAEKLESLLGKMQEAKALLDEIPEILRNFRQSVLAAACLGRLTEDWRKEHRNVESAAELVHKIYSNKLNDETLPKDFLLQDDEGALPGKWIRVRLGSLSQLITKGASPKWQGFNYVDDGTLFITSENVGNGRLLLESRKHVENDFNRVQKRSILQKGDLLTNIVGASIGRSAIFDLDENANINQAVAVIRAYPEIISKYILIALNSPSTIDFMHKEKVDVARANLSLQDVSNFPINLPPTAEQFEIVRRIESLFRKADDLEAQYKEAMELIESLPEIILSKAFRGELVPQDPNDEPASVLLERISAAKEKAIVTGKQTRGKKAIRSL